MKSVPYMRYIDFSDEVKCLIKEIWGEDKPPAPNVLLRQAGNKGVSVEHYLKGRLANPNYENGRMPKKFRDELNKRNASRPPIIHTEETKAKMRSVHMGKAISEEQRERYSVRST
jgi:hypothetical protein